MSKGHNKILLTVPCMQDQGGVSGFFNSILPFSQSDDVLSLEIGSTFRNGGFLHPLVDQFRFRMAMKEFKPKLIHLNPSLGLKSFFRDGLFALQAKQMGYPVLVFWHGWDKRFELQVERKLRSFFSATFGKADCFVVLASDFKRKLRKWGVSVPIFLETTSVADGLLDGFVVEEKWSQPKQIKSFKILFLARLERAKGVFETIHSFKLLIDKQLPISLTIAGDGKIRSELEEYARNLDLRHPQINFTGDIRGEAKKKVLSEHHIYCLPSYGEGLPCTVLEAMAFGMPIVTRSVGGLADVFEDGIMGAFVLGKGAAEIATCIEKIITDRERMAVMGRYNASYAREHFMASVVARRLAKIYESILS